MALIEVMVAVMVLMVGLLGMAAMQARGQQAAMESLQRSQAMLLLNDMADRIIANRLFASCYIINGYVGTGANFAAPGCNGLADNDLTAWNNLLLGAQESLNNGNVGGIVGARGCITLVQNQVYQVTVAWQGLSKVFNNTTNTCGSGLYGDDSQRRLLTRTVRIAILN